MDDTKTYEETVQALSKRFKSNAQVIADFKKHGCTREYGERRLIENEHHLMMAGIGVNDIAVLNPIHIAGTKGKGSVSAMCESILRAHGYRTGSVSSPHLLEVRERIRINGKPISKEMFVKYFWDCFNQMHKNCVDVAIVEVGIGGAYCTTNIMRHPKVCGITSLGYDHTDLLGKTIKEISWHKTGIFKAGVPAVTVSQPPEGLEVIAERAKELKVSSVMVVPKYSAYPNAKMCSLRMQGEHQLENASLSVQICKTWLDQMSTAQELDESSKDDQEELLSLAGNNFLCKESKIMKQQDNFGKLMDEHLKHDISIAAPFPLSQLFLKGLENCYLPGRCQHLTKQGISYFLDAAHTNKSLRYCAEWFEKASMEDASEHKNLTPVRIMLFYFTGYRDANFLMMPLLQLKFDQTVFCPNIIKASTEMEKSLNDAEDPIIRCEKNALLWKQLHEKNVEIPSLTSEPIVFKSISKAFSWLDEIKSDNTHLQVLVCGSFYLVSGVLSILGYDTDSLFGVEKEEGTSKHKN